MALTGCFSATGRLTSPRLCACYLSSYLSSCLSSTLISICPHLSWVGGWVIQFLPSRLIGYLGDLHGFFPSFTSPLPFLAIGLCDWPWLSPSIKMRFTNLGALFDSSGSPAARSVVPLSLSLFVEVARGSRRAQRSEHTERHTCHFGGSRAFVPSRREAHLRSGKIWKEPVMTARRLRRPRWG